jgi:hypothetical protein
MTEALLLEQMQWRAIGSDLLIEGYLQSLATGEGGN